MTSVKVVDLNETTKEQPVIEEAPKEEEPLKEQPEPKNEVVTEEPVEARQSPATYQEAPTEATKETPAPKPKAKARPKPSDLVFCPDCSRQMTYKNLRYSHKCSPEPPPVKKQAKPKPKTKPKQPPKPPPEVYYSESDDDDDDDDDEPLQQPLIKKKQPKQQPNPLLDITNQYALLHQQLMQQRQEKYNKVCAGMFAPRTKKR